MARFSICKSTKFGREFEEVTILSAKSAFAAERDFRSGKAPVQPKPGVYHVLKYGNYRHKFKI